MDVATYRNPLRLRIRKWAGVLPLSALTAHCRATPAVLSPANSTGSSQAWTGARDRIRITGQMSIEMSVGLSPVAQCGGTLPQSFGVNLHRMSRNTIQKPPI